MPSWHIIPIFIFVSNLYLKLALLTIDQAISITLDEDISYTKVERPKRSNDIQQLMYPQTEDLYYTHGSGVESRSRRAITIAFPRFSLLVQDYYINIPLLAPGHVFTPLTLQARYYMVMPNTTFSLSKGRYLRDRLDLFQTAENLFNSVGLDGKACMLRALCERAEFHLVTDGVLGEAVSMLLEFTAPNDISFQDYEKAREHGETIGDCASTYKDCSISLFTWFED